MTIPYPWKVHRTPKNINKEVHFFVRCRVKACNFTKDEFFQGFFQKILLKQEIVFLYKLFPRFKDNLFLETAANGCFYMHLTIFGCYDYVALL